MELKENLEDEKPDTFVRSSLVNVIEVKDREGEFMRVRLYLDSQEVEGWIPEDKLYFLGSIKGGTI